MKQRGYRTISQRPHPMRACADVFLITGCDYFKIESSARTPQPKIDAAPHKRYNAGRCLRALNACRAALRFPANGNRWIVRFGYGLYNDFGWEKGYL